MAADVKVDSLDLLKQYQGYFRNFADCVEAGVVAYRDKLKSQKEEAQRLKREAESRADNTLDTIDYRIRQLEDLKYRYTFASQDIARFDIEIEKFRSRRESIVSKIDTIMEKLERQIGILDDIYNLTYSYGNKTREMANSANGSLTGIIGTLSNYQPK